MYLTTESSPLRLYGCIGGSSDLGVPFSVELGPLWRFFSAKNLDVWPKMGPPKTFFSAIFYFETKIAPNHRPRDLIIRVPSCDLWGRRFFLYVQISRKSRFLKSDHFGQNGRFWPKISIFGQKWDHPIFFSGDFLF